MLRHHYERLFAGDPPQLRKAQAVAARVVEFTEFALRLGLDFNAAKSEPVKVALHTSCSARREMNTLQAGRELLRQLPGVALVEHSHEAECCGFGGTFAVKHPEISAAMTTDKIDAIEASGCELLVSADCGCLANLNCMLERRGSALRGMHIATFVRDRLGRTS
jgi:L-lactate dehydrogenase complex protein LldE